MSIKLNLEKAQKSLRLNLQKAGVATAPVLDVGFALDVSGSFHDEHVSGVTDKLLTRLVPWGLTFDPDKKLDVSTFADTASGVDQAGEVTAENYYGYIQNHIIDKVARYGCGTDYSYVLEGMLGHFGWRASKRAGLFHRLFGRREGQANGQQKRSLVIVATDGENSESDKSRTMRVLRESEARCDQVYFLFLGISNQHQRFPLLEQIADAFDNTGFVGIDNLERFVGGSDDDVNEKLIGPKLLNWFKR